jgi:hypothetical protein
MPVRVQTQFLVQDLHPATWYVMIVTANSDAGATDSELKFATLTYTGSESRDLELKVHLQAPLIPLAEVTRLR